MNRKKTWIDPHNERGSIIVIVLLILCIVTVIGISSLDTTVIEQQVVSNDQNKKIATYNADGGVFLTTKIISRVLQDQEPVITDFDATKMIYVKGTADPPAADAASLFFNEIMGYKDILNRDYYDIDPDLRFTVYDSTDPRPNNDPLKRKFTIDADIRRITTRPLRGGGVEFATGYEGIGSGILGGAATYYAETVRGTGPRDSVNEIYVEYRKVIGIPNAGEL